ncbi:helix-turn-helix domain-containing protein [Mitsuaria sp. GD03876]|uniref:GlxA family transcriptional regulator n=1 Tax=Mitsuaria sp. GD03876 TaxID=2975399 RepID=UPI00244AAAB8|nr:helix-turn-helix domain-containing protein [Mitsuaria sp. GD03876]MDH0867653.1 helix-turn-helix domain-containing protein [Mitsuaria sp. GD03876]
MPARPVPVPPSTTAVPHRIAVLALPGLIAFDLTLACEVFGRAELADGRKAYAVIVCGEQAEIDVGGFTLGVRRRLSALKQADTIVVPGIASPEIPVSAAVLRALRAAQARGARIASICSGAFVLAQAGLLDGRRATTHWAAASLMAALHPAVDLDPSVLFVDDGQVLTSAGAAAGIDLCLHMVRADLGTAVAARVARLSVVPLQREGGQAQFIEAADLPPDRDLQPVIDWALANLHRPISMEDLAREGCVSTRTLHRRFLQRFGVAPVRWLIEARVRRAQELLETGSLAIEQIVAAVGLGSAANFRAQFQRIAGVSPSGYRKSFGPRA